jgi:predicted GNAT family N-acyltransferase
MKLSAMQTNFDKCYFRPALYWQTIHDWQCADAGLEFRMNFTTKVNEAKFSSDVTLSQSSLTKCRAEQLCIVPESAARPDTIKLSERMRNAATWNKPDDLEHLIRTCYVTATVAIPCLIEASKRNFIDVVTLLLQAGANPITTDPTSNKSALYVACEGGQEDVAKLLIVATKTTNSQAVLAAIQVARNNDMGFMARRLEALWKEQTISNQGETKNIEKTVVTRHGKVEDLDNIYKLVNRAYELEKGDSGIAFKKEGKERYNKTEEVFDANHSPESFLILEENTSNGEKEMVGVASVTRILKENKGDARIVATFGPFAIAENKRNMGYGTKLLTSIELHSANELGASSLKIEVVNHRSDLFPFYEKRGFVNKGETRPFEDPESLSRDSHFLILEKVLHGTVM